MPEQVQISPSKELEGTFGEGTQTTWLVTKIESVLLTCIKIMVPAVSAARASRNGRALARPMQQAASQACQRAVPADSMTAFCHAGPS